MKLAAMGSAMGPGRRALGLLLAVTGAANGLSALGRAASTTARASPIRMMPIGVPKVAYRAPGAQNADWVDLYNRLYRERILFLGQAIDDELTNQIIGVMLFLDAEDNNKPMSMYINSPGGSVTSGFAIFDTMRHVKCDISTINIGLAASMGSLLLVAGTKGKRLALQHSRTMIHQPGTGSSAIRGQASDIKVEAERVLLIRNKVVDYYATLTGNTKEKVRLDIDRDNFMSADQALAYGMIDRVITSTKM